MNKIQLFLIVFFMSFCAVFAQEKPYTKYEVQKGETLQSISQKLSITPYTLLKLNPDVKNDLEGVSVLIIPNKNYNPAKAQTAHKDYVENGFLYHKVLPKENYFQFKQKYKVSKRVLRRHNPILRRQDLKDGQIIRIPVSDDFQLEETPVEATVAEQTNEVVKDSTTATKPYLVKAKENKFRISKNHGISIEDLEALNPILKTEPLKVGMVILVPDSVKEEDKYKMHLVKQGETLYSLTKMYNLTQEDLEELNPALKEEGLKEGLVLKIPRIMTEFTASSAVFMPKLDTSRVVNVVFMLPFMANSVATVDFEKNRASDVVTDFYLGAQMALDSVKKQGLSMNVKVFDTQNNPKLIDTYLKTINFDKVDLIIGPMFLNNLDQVSKKLIGKQIPIISPVSRKDHSSILNASLIQEAPRNSDLSDKMLNYLTSKYEDQHILVISDDKEENAEKVNTVVAQLQALDTLARVDIIKPEKGYIKPAIFRKKLKTKNHNWVVLVTEDAVVTKDVINNLGVLPKNMKTTFFTLYKGDNFDHSKGINNKLAHVNFHYPTHTFINHEDEKLKRFVERYTSLNFAEPTEYSFKGFDVTYDALLRFGSFQSVNEALAAGKSEGVTTRFEYIKNSTNNSFVNKGIYIVKYDDLNLVVVDEESKQ